MTERRVTVLGAGLAGCEAAYAAAERGARVKLYEMKPQKYTPAHHAPTFGELVCSNSLRSDAPSNAIGLLKSEMREMGSLIMQAADATRVPAGSALAVDRVLFSEFITEKIQKHPNIEIVNREVDSVEPETVTVIATGPLTSDAMADYITHTLQCGKLHFFDAASPLTPAAGIVPAHGASFRSVDRGRHMRIISRYFFSCPDRRLGVRGRRAGRRSEPRVTSPAVPHWALARSEQTPGEKTRGIRREDANLPRSRDRAQDGSCDEQLRQEYEKVGDEVTLAACSAGGAFGRLVHACLGPPQKIRPRQAGRVLSF